MFTVSSPWLIACYDESTDTIGTTLKRPYFSPTEQDESDGAKSYALKYGDWIRLLRRDGLTVEDLIELQAAADAKTSYFRTEPLDWAHHWPPEILWVARRAR